ncbi:MAG: DNA adenine methylase, partial [Christensenellales bacterium]
TVSKTYGNISDSTVADLFSGTVVVAEMFKSLGAKLITNDYMSFSYALQLARIKLNKEPCCFINYYEAIDELNNLQGEEGFIYYEYCLEGTKEKKFQRNYFSPENALKIDAIRRCIERWKKEGKINSDMFYLLCADLVNAVTRVSNISGTYGAFLKIDDQRKYKPIKLIPSSFINNGMNNECFNKDIFEIINDVSGDILYLDPPYNSRQYPPYYHILETVTEYDSPAIYGLTGRRPYQDKLSPFCMKDKALPALLNIVERARFKNIYISYNTDGIINYQELGDQLKKIADVNYFFMPFRRYKSNSNGNDKGKLKEIIIYAKKRD